MGERITRNASIEAAEWANAEIARLRAEVEGLILDDEARAKACAELGEHLTEVQCERDEALAQVAVLLIPIQGLCTLLTSNDLGRESVREVMRILENLPAEARTLLDRLRRAEAVGEAAKPIWERMALFGGIAKMPITVVFTWEEAIKFKETLAAWEEETA